MVLPAVLASMLVNGAPVAPPSNYTALQREYYFTAMQLAEREYALNNTASVLALLAKTEKNPEKGFEWGYWKARCSQQLASFMPSAGAVTASCCAFTWLPGEVLCALTNGDIVSLAPETGTITGRRHIAASFGAVTFSEDGKALLSVAGYKTVGYRIDTGEQFFTSRGASSAMRASFLPGQNRVVTAGLDGWVQIWDTATGKQVVRQTDRAVGSFYTLNVSRNGELIGSGDDGCVAWIYKSDDGATRFRLRGHTAQISCEAFSPDGKIFATGSWDNTVQLWDTSTGERFATLTGHTGVIRDICFRADSKAIYTAGNDGTIKMWSTANGQLLRDQRGANAPIMRLGLSPDGSKVASLASNGRLHIWDARDREQGKAPEDPIGTSFANTQRSKLPFRLSGIGINPPPISFDGTLAFPNSMEGVDVWQVQTGKKLFTLPTIGAASTVLLTPGRRMIAVGDASGKVSVYDARTGNLLWQMNAGNSKISAIACGAADTLLAIATENGNCPVQIWSLINGRKLRQTTSSKFQITRLSFEASGSRIAASDSSRAALVFETSTGKQICTLPEAGASVGQSMVISPNGDRIVTTVGKSMLWNGKTGAQVCALSSGTDYYRGAFSPDGRRLILGSYGGEAKLFETLEGRELISFHTGGEERWVTRVAFAANGHRIDIHNSALPPISYISSQ